MTAVLHKMLPFPLLKIPNVLTPTNWKWKKHDLILKIAIDRENIRGIWSLPASRPGKMNCVTMAVDTLASYKIITEGKKKKKIFHIL